MDLWHTSALRCLVISVSSHSVVNLIQQREMLTTKTVVGIFNHNVYFSEGILHYVAAIYALRIN